MPRFQCDHKRRPDLCLECGTVCPCGKRVMRSPVHIKRHEATKYHRRRTGGIIPEDAPKKPNKKELEELVKKLTIENNAYKDALSRITQ